MIATPCERSRTGPLTPGAIARFLLPLVVSAWLMALVGPVLNVSLARADQPQLNLAAFWLAFSILLLTQSSCVILQQATSVALRRHVPLFTIACTGAALGSIASGMVLLMGLSPLGDGLFLHALPTATETAALARAALVVMSPIPLLVALRGVFAGYALFERRTGLLAAATVARLLVLAMLTAAVLYGDLQAGVISAAWALLAAALADAIVVGATVLKRRRRAAAWKASAPRPLRAARDLRELLRVAVPLAAASLVWTAVRPLVGAVLGHLAEPELAQAAFGVVLPILMLSCAPLWGFLEVVLVLPRDEADVRRVVQFALVTSAVFSFAILLVVLTPLRSLLLADLFALTPRLEKLVAPALVLLAFEPLVLSARAISQGLLLRSGHGALVLALSPVKLAAMAGLGFTLVNGMPHANGAFVALGLLLAGDLADAVLYGAAVVRTGSFRTAGGEKAEAPDLEFRQEAA